MERTSAFLSQLSPVVKEAAGNSMSQMRTFVKQAQQPTAQFLGQVGTATGSMLSGTPTPTTYQGGINPGGLLGAVGMKGAASQLQAAMQNPQTAQMLGAGVLGAGVLGLGAAGVAAAMANRRGRKAGQNLGAQLGVNMPPA